MSETIAKTQRDLLHDLPRLKLRMPASTRELFQLLALHDSAQGLPGLLDRIDLSAVTPARVHQLVHGRAPAGAIHDMHRDGTDARTHLLAALHSREFQSDIVGTLLTSFPEKRREVFIHIPKCAGTDLALNLAPRRLSIPYVLSAEGWISKDELLAAVVEMVKAMPFYDDVFVFGHIELSAYAERVGVRPNDTFFTIIREPFDLMLSQANFSVSRLCQDPTGRTPDTAGLLKLLDLPRLPENPSGKFLKDLAAACLLDPRIAQPNRICFYLGKTGDRSFASAMANLVAFDFEITTAAEYNRWLKERWSIGSTTQHNRSTTFLGRREAERLFAGVLADRIAEDQKFYDTVAWALKRTGAASVRGAELARLAGNDLLTGTLRARDARARAGSAQGSLLAAQGAKASELYLHPIRHELVPADRRIVPVLAISFGANGNSRSYAREGWSKPEREFTWTSGNEALLQVPRPSEAADYLLRLHANPFTSKESLPSQRVVVVVNGDVLGTATLTELSVIECELPWALLDGTDVIDIKLSLPDARNASTVKNVQDERTLALAVRTVSLLQAGATVAVQGAPGQVADKSTRQLMLRFEGLGGSHEFGSLQRCCGVEPLGLLRFSSTPLAALLRALKGRFAGVGHPEAIDVEAPDGKGEYTVRDRAYDLRFRVWIDVGDQSPAEVHARESRRLPFLVRKLVDDLTDPQRIFVFCGVEPLSEEQARELAAAIRTYGPATLLWVKLADDSNRPGSVVRVAPGLLKGHLDRFAPIADPHDLSLDCWIDICRGALALTEPAPALHAGS